MFEAALSKLPAPTDGQKKFLTAHLAAPGHAPTTTLLADAAKYDGYKGINLQYGILAAKIEQELGLAASSRIGLEQIVDLVKPAAVTNDHWILIMKDAFAKALIRSNWLA